MHNHLWFTWFVVLMHLNLILKLKNEQFYLEGKHDKSEHGLLQVIIKVCKKELAIHQVNFRKTSHWLLKGVVLPGIKSLL